ncbi:hypothetical protein I4F81_010574 [Pyropia yezoensis]|uniref:Uncharacterized protein n=1 Tax=Pyropia yezoensis TaxID=2788 RepID=A0ACC3CE11_PYRYE|nr:hypothetical protein I4F81_010574 [Neopyropia yezoensis]
MRLSLPREGSWKFPHSSSSFVDIRRTGTFFVDKTEYIAELEAQNAQHIVIVRPPRTGKTLFCSMMAAYYDIARADDFDNYFNGLEVGDNPTESHSSYYVLFLHLDDMPGDDAKAEEMNDATHAVINLACVDFQERYGMDFTIDRQHSDVTVANLAKAVAAQVNKRLYVIVDEYDRGPNSMMLASPIAYMREVQRQLRAKSSLSSALRRLYSTFKRIGDGSAQVDLEKFRTFTTGITPLALADASIFNVGLYVTILPEIAGAFGFHDGEVMEAIHAANSIPKAQQQNVFNLLRRFYNNLRFYTSSGPTLFHPMLTMSFFNRMQSSSSFREVILRGLADGEDDDYFASYMDNYNVTASQSAVNFLVKHALAVIPFIFDEVCGADGTARVSLFNKPFSFQDLLLPPPDDVDGLEQVRLFLTYYGILYCTDRMLVRQANGSRVDMFMLSSSNKVGQMASFPLRRALSATGDQVVNLLRAPTPALVRAIFQSFVSAPTLVAAQVREEQERQQRNADGKVGRVTGSTERNLNEAGFQFGARVFFQSWVRYAGRCNTHVRVEAQTTVQDGKCRCDLVLHQLSSNEVILFELKRIQVSCIDYTEFKIDRGMKTPLKEHLKFATSNTTFSTQFSDDTILDLPLKDSYLLNGKTCPDGKRYHVRDVASDASAALKRYERNFSLSATGGATVVAGGASAAAEAGVGGRRGGQQ